MTDALDTSDHKGLLARFHDFDRAVSRDISLDPPKDMEDSITRLFRLIEALPQREAIQSHHAEKWLERCVQMAMGRMEMEHGNVQIKDVHDHVLWHIRRASGFGGSDAGTLLKHMDGKRGNFTTAHNLVLEKLLIMSPQPSTPEMSRGIRAEPWIQKIYQEKTGSRTDDASLALLRGFRWDRAPFLAGTPDDIVIQTSQKRRLVDYKAPSADVCSGYESNGISEDYVAQLHHYATIAMAAGCRFSEMSIEVLDPRCFDVISYEVPFDKEIARRIVGASRQIWIDNVMQGVVPDAPSSDVLNSDDPDLIDFGHQAAMFRAMKEQAEAREKEMIERISVLGTVMHDKATGKLELGVADYIRNRSWDEDQLKSLAVAAGLDISDHEKVTDNIDLEAAGKCLSDLLEAYREGHDIQERLTSLLEEGLPMKKKLDAAGLAEALEDYGIDTIEAAGIKASFGLTRKKKGLGAERLVELRTAVSDLMEDLDEVVRETAGKIIKGEKEPEVIPDL